MAKLLKDLLAAQGPGDAWLHALHADACNLAALLLATVTFAPLLLWVCPYGSHIRTAMAKTLKDLLGAVVMFTLLATLLQTCLMVLRPRWRTRKPKPDCWKDKDPEEDAKCSEPPAAKPDCWKGKDPEEDAKCSESPAARNVGRGRAFASSFVRGIICVACILVFKLLQDASSSQSNLQNRSQLFPASPEFPEFLLTGPAPSNP
ncbi:hypothetical protein T484DRAFT_1782388 [Baffinella frigidus]|nr:hypothetical protein T484DRAFT_1782388 [Cryptophyta sp. CCMP2293]